MTQSQVRDTVTQYLNNRGAEIAQLDDDTLLFQYLSSVEFMELMLQLESVTGIPLDLANADIEQVVTLEGLIQWAEQSNNELHH
ncbi:Uncharacterised protein [BD1-7 clade bacterium]|uniref:Carrier domain-containing protein n=1 Tax=BD1-7 clade bacterium TaxID=2029982 RepID=A0A5S9QAX1_9GAMM|nr:Uncharacterised protein [BD1-7 clade bacterium]